MLQAEEMDKDLDDPMFNHKTNCFKKHLKTILIAIGALIVITVVVIILIVVLKDDDDKDKGSDKGKEEEDKKPYDYGLDLEELKRRTSPENLNTFVLLKPTSEEYLNLKDGDKKALKYLVKAGAILENIQLRIDEYNNIPFKKFLEEEIKKGVEKANLTKIVFDGQKGINAMDALSNKIYLAKGITQKPGLGVYPEDITKEELHKILIKMLKEKKIEEVK